MTYTRKTITDKLNDKETRNKIKELLKSEKYEFLGIRGVEEELEIGEILDTSYLWDYELDVSTYDTDEPIELGGVCTVDLTFNIHYDYNMTAVEDEFIEEIIDDMLPRFELAEGYRFNHYYIVGSNSQNPYDMEENDEHESILENAEVLIEL